jgi:CubicO group peptidase (beta-lactamase class C family)
LRLPIVHGITDRAMHRCPAAKLLMFAVLVAAAGAHAQTSEGGLDARPEDPLPKLPRDATYVLDGSLERVRQSFSIPGMAIGIVENGEPVYVRAFGVRDLETGEPVTVHTSFHVASLTKTFTTAALMQLIEQQRLALDAPIAQYVPAFANSPITVTQLMTHSAGLKDIAPPSKAFAEDALNKYAISLAKHEVAYPPGQGWGYTDAAFNLLGAAIESITDTPYPRYIQTEVLNKAGMHESSFELPDPLGDTAWPHTGKVFVSRASEYPYDRAMAPSSGLNSSINDMTRWAALHVNRDPALLSAGSYEAMFKHHLDSSWEGMAMGLGWQLEKRGDSWLPRHYGQEHGFTTSITLYPQQRRAIVILSNGETTPRGEIRKLIESVLETGSYVTPQPPLLLRFNSPWLMGGIAAVVLVLIGSIVSMFRRRRQRR